MKLVVPEVNPGWPDAVTVIIPVFTVDFILAVAAPLKHGIDCGNTEPSNHVPAFCVPNMLSVTKPE
jgi:hypothetical protein